MGFRLPRYDELTNQQRSVLDLPSSKDFVVEGAPGTGKTVLAIYRAANLSRQKKKVLMLVYNVPLFQYLRNAIQYNHINAEVNTFHSWIINFYYSRFQKPIPLYQNHSYDYDWDVVIEQFSSLGQQYDTVILDEAQDLPTELVIALKKIAKTVNCFKDEKQTITHVRSRIDENIEEVLGSHTLYYLVDNFRNPIEIFRFAQLFTAGEQNIEVKKRSGEKPHMIKYKNEDELIRIIQNIIDRNYALSYIGVLTDYSSQKRLYLELTDKLAGKPPVYLYNSDNQYIDFDKTGVFVITHECMKGLEFDAVIMPAFDNLVLNKDEEKRANTVYVAISRSSNKFYGLYKKVDTQNANFNALGPVKGHEELLSWNN